MSAENINPPDIGPDISQPAKRRTRRTRRGAPIPHAICYTVEDAHLLGGPGRTKLYELASQGKVLLLRVGGRVMVEGNSLRRLLLADPLPADRRIDPVRSNSAATAAARRKAQARAGATTA